MQRPSSDGCLSKLFVQVLIRCNAVDKTVGSSREDFEGDNMKASGLFFTALFAIVLLSAGEAFAYLDPTSGSMILQGLIAAFVGIAAVGRLYWTKIKNLFKTKTKVEMENKE